MNHGAESMIDPAAAYVFGGNEAELQRLVVQAAGLEPEARWLLDKIAIRPGARAADIGCGPVGILNLLSERVGDGGFVIGLEREARFVDMARAEIQRRGVSNTSIIGGDIFGPALQIDSLDFVHERLVLMNMPEVNQKALITRMLGLLKSGGIIALQDYDRVSCLCYPEHPSWTVLLAAYNDAFRAHGGSGATGRTLPLLLRSAGAQNVQAEIHAKFVDVDDSRRMHHLGLVEVMSEKILDLGRFDAAEFAEHRRALRQHLSDPDTTVIDHLLVQAWGHAP
jgi:SAM-dependent methyltransferase